jgi:hypothetical protein
LDLRYPGGVRLFFNLFTQRERFTPVEQHMALSKVEYTGNGATTDFAVTFPYLKQAHVFAKVAGVLTSFTWVNSGLIRFAAAPASGAFIRIYRDTSSTSRIVDYTVPGTLTEEDLDNDSFQAFYLAQESNDRATEALGIDIASGQWDAQAKRITNGAAPLVGTDIATKNYVDSVASGTVPQPFSVAIGGTGFSSVGADGRVMVSSGGVLVFTDYTREPLNVNPNMVIDQINEGALYTINGVGVQGPDGWTGSTVGTGVFKLRTVVDPDNAALKCLEITCTTADAAIAAADSYQIFTAIEGFDVADLKIGTASASQATVLMKFKSNVAGVYGVALVNSAGNRANIGIITAPDANEHFYALTFSLDTAGVWLYTNGIGLQLVVSLAQGSNLQSVAGNWGAGAGRTTAAQCNFMSNVANIAYLRAHVIPGGVALAYHARDISRELRKAQRYFTKSFDQGRAVAQNSGDLNGVAVAPSPGTASGMNFTDRVFKSEMRGVPTMLSYNPLAANAFARDIQSNVDCTATAFGVIGTSGFQISATTGVGSGTTNRVAVHWTANARLS